MRIAVLLLATLLTGCFVLPSKTTTTRRIGTEASEPRMGLSRGLSLTAAAQRGNVIVTAIRTRECHREIREVLEVTERRGLRMGGVEDPRGAVFGLLLSPVTIPVSFLISGISVAADHENHYEKRRVIGHQTAACTEAAARVPITVTLESGVSFTRPTDATGVLAFPLPPDEPYHGIVTARAETSVTQLKYRRKPPGVTAVRDAVTSCAQEAAFSGSLEVRVGVNAAGLPIKVELDHADDALTTCITTNIASARFPSEQRDTTLVMPFSL